MGRWIVIAEAVWMIALIVAPLIQKKIVSDKWRYLYVVPAFVTCGLAFLVGFNPYLVGMCVASILTLSQMDLKITKAKMILSNGSYSEGTAIATALSIQASATYYAAIIGTSELANVGKVTLTYTTPGGTAPSEAWICYSTNRGSTWSVAKKVTSLSTSGTDFVFDATIASARYAFVIHSTGYCQFKVPVLTFYEGATAGGSQEPTV